MYIYDGNDEKYPINLEQTATVEEGLLEAFKHILLNSLYESNQSTNIHNVLGNLSVKNTGRWAIIYDLNNTSLSNTVLFVKDGEPFQTTIKSSLDEESTVVFMGGKDVTDNVLNNNEINIDSVSNHVVVTNNFVTITYNLEGVTLTNNVTRIERGVEYNTIYKIENGTKLDTISIIVGDEDVTEDCVYDGNRIIIENVTDDITITIKAIEEIDLQKGIVLDKDFRDLVDSDDYYDTLISDSFGSIINPQFYISDYMELQSTVMTSGLSLAVLVSNENRGCRGVLSGGNTYSSNGLAITEYSPTATSKVNYSMKISYKTTDGNIKSHNFFTEGFPDNSWETEYYHDFIITIDSKELKVFTSNGGLIETVSSDTLSDFDSWYLGDLNLPANYTSRSRYASKYVFLKVWNRVISDSELSILYEDINDYYIDREQYIESKSVGYFDFTNKNKLSIAENTIYCNDTINLEESSSKDFSYSIDNNGLKCSNMKLKGLANVINTSGDGFALLINFNNLVSSNNTVDIIKSEGFTLTYSSKELKLTVLLDGVYESDNTTSINLKDDTELCVIVRRTVLPDSNSSLDRNKYAKIKIKTKDESSQRSFERSFKIDSILDSLVLNSGNNSYIKDIRIVNNPLSLYLENTIGKGIVREGLVNHYNFKNINKESISSLLSLHTNTTIDDIYSDEKGITGASIKGLGRYSLNMTVCLLWHEENEDDLAVYSDYGFNPESNFPITSEGRYGIFSSWYLLINGNRAVSIRDDSNVLKNIEIDKWKAGYNYAIITIDGDNDLLKLIYNDKEYSTSINFKDNSRYSNDLLLDISCDATARNNRIFDRHFTHLTTFNRVLSSNEIKKTISYFKSIIEGA